MSAWVQTASKGGGEGFEKAPAGNHPAVLVAIVDMGTQSNEFGGKQTWQRRAYFIWELVSAKMSGTKDRNHLIGIDLTVSLNEKAKLRQWIEARKAKKMPEGANYDILKELGQPCLLNVVLNASGYPKVNGVSAIPAGLTVPAAQHQPFSWSLEDYEKEGTIELPEWVETQWLYGEPISAHIRRCKEIANPDDGKPSADDDQLAAAMEGRLSTDGGRVGSDDPIPY